MSEKEFKVVLAGDFGSGRSTFINRFKAAKGDKQKVAALKAEIYPLKLHTSAGPVTLSVYDSTLHAKGGIPDAAFYRGADLVLLFFSLTSSDSYSSLDKHHAASTAGTRQSNPIPLFVVGNKLDDVKGREVKAGEVDWPKKKGLEGKYREVSAKGTWGVKEVLLEVLQELVGSGVQLTETLDLVDGEVKVDEEAAEKAKKEYDAAFLA